MTNSVTRILTAVLCVLCASALISTAGCTERPVIRHAMTNPPQAYHIHLPGIGGYRSIDRMLLAGLQEGGLDAQIQPYDWTTGDPGLGALLGTERHKREALKVSKMIRDTVEHHPAARVTVSCHSGGAGILAWALEQLPADVKVDDIIFLAPALSPEYDLTAALRHVRDKAYVFYSPYDVAVLGIGTRMFGTIDGEKVEASGKVGFAKPDTADDRQYAKLVQIPYESEREKLGNIGDHIGTLSRPFGKEVLAPLLLTGQLPPMQEAQEAGLKTPATMPSPGAPAQPPGEFQMPAAAAQPAPPSAAQ
jgi:hypothetical protein